jgi:hypothetical protein
MDMAVMCRYVQAFGNLVALLKRDDQLLPVLKCLQLLMNHIPDKHGHLARYYGCYAK